MSAHDDIQKEIVRRVLSLALNGCVNSSRPIVVSWMSVVQNDAFYYVTSISFPTSPTQEEQEQVTQACDLATQKARQMNLRTGAMDFKSQGIQITQSRTAHARLEALSQLEILSHV